MANEKKKSKGPQDRNSNYQMKNGNSLSKKNKKSNEGRPVEKKSVSAAAKSGEKKSLISGLSSSISSATNSITKMLKH